MSQTPGDMTGEQRIEWRRWFNEVLTLACHIVTDPDIHETEYFLKALAARSGISYATLMGVSARWASTLAY